MFMRHVRALWRAVVYFIYDSFLFKKKRATRKTGVERQGEGGEGGKIGRDEARKGGGGGGEREEREEREGKRRG